MKLGRGTLRHINCTVRRRVDGRWIELPVLSGLKVGISGERFLYDILKHFLPKLDGTVIDVGVNLGQTLCKVKLVDPNRSYYGFEPNAACHAYLDDLVRANAWSTYQSFRSGCRIRHRYFAFIYRLISRRLDGDRFCRRFYRTAAGKSL